MRSGLERKPNIFILHGRHGTADQGTPLIIERYSLENAVYNGKAGAHAKSSGISILGPQMHMLKVHGFRRSPAQLRTHICGEADPDQGISRTEKDKRRK